MRHCLVWLLTGLFWFFAPAWLHAQIQQGKATCTVVLGVLNRNRVVLAPNQGVHITAECSGDRADCFPLVEHSVPFGNWGVSSNAGSKEAGDQFQGWKCGDKFCQWNSCTSEFPPANCTYYNSAGCTQQATTTGNNVYGNIGTRYGVKCPWELPEYGLSGGGCQNLDGKTITVSNNFMTLYEIDPCDPDELVQTMLFPDVSVTLSCDQYSCTGTPSSWAGPIGYDSPVWPPLVDAEIALALAFAELDDSECYDPFNECPPCTEEPCQRCTL